MVRMVETGGCIKVSGGRWNYEQNHLGYEMFPGCDICYGLGDNDKNKYSNYFGSMKLARKINPMEDKQISELVFDILCLVYSADWYQSGDTGENTYREDLKYFKEKWLKKSEYELFKKEIDMSIEETKEELYKELVIEEVKDG